MFMTVVWIHSGCCHSIFYIGHQAVLEDYTGKPAGSYAESRRTPSSIKYRAYSVTRTTIS